MIRIDLQYFAHKKGMGSTKNGRDSESKRLGVKHHLVPGFQLHFHGSELLGEVAGRSLQQSPCQDRKSTRLNSSHTDSSRMPSSA